MTSKLPPPVLTADHAAVDLLNSVGAPWGAHLDWLESGADLVDWMAQAGLVSAPDADRLKASASAASLDAAAQEARELRELLRGHLTSPSRQLIERLNHWLEHVAYDTRIVHDDWPAYFQDQPTSTPRLQVSVRIETADDLLAVLARSIADLLCNTDRDRTRGCDGPSCTFWFHDITKNNSRRWCSMAICGNRAKAAAHRARRKSDPD